MRALAETLFAPSDALARYYAATRMVAFALVVSDAVGGVRHGPRIAVAHLSFSLVGTAVAHTSAIGSAHASLSQVGRATSSLSAVS
jgi:hypothetical protein